MFPERFSNLPAYAFPRLRALLDVHPAGGPVMHMTIGEPKHAFPDWVGQILADNIAGFGQYPPNEGTPGLRSAITGFLDRRYGVTIDPETQVMPLNGTREGLYNAAMALIPEQKNGQQPIVLIPNPFYQVYMIGAISVRAQPMFIAATRDNGYLPDYTALPPEVLNRVAAAYICSPANPQGSVASRDYWADLIRLAEQYDFQIFADECYSEIYRTDPPVGAMQVAQDLGADPDRVVIFHSLSKRSNLPGLRSGFVAGGADSLTRIKQLRAYAGAPLPLPIQHVSQAVWEDEAHVVENRRLYGEKYQIADQVFASIQGYQGPEAGFFLWLPVEDGEQAALTAWRETGVRVLPGAYLSKDVTGDNPGKGYIRVAMVAEAEEMRTGLIRLRDCIYK